MPRQLTRRIVRSGTVKWSWHTPYGLAVISGGAGGGGGGGGAVCIEGLNIYGASGGNGGDGGNATGLTIRGRSYRAAGGNGGYGGDSGSILNGEPQVVSPGSGCHFGLGGDGGEGTAVARREGRLVSDGGDGGKGFPGEIEIVEFADLRYGDDLDVEIGTGGLGGDAGQGFENGRSGTSGGDGFVLLVPIFEAGEVDAGDG